MVTTAARLSHPGFCFWFCVHMAVQGFLEFNKYIDVFPAEVQPEPAAEEPEPAACTSTSFVALSADLDSRILTAAVARGLVLRCLASAPSWGVPQNQWRRRRYHCSIVTAEPESEPKAEAETEADSTSVNELTTSMGATVSGKLKPLSKLKPSKKKKLSECTTPSLDDALARHGAPRCTRACAHPNR